jgi:hypothetical protein
MFQLGSTPRGPETLMVIVQVLDIDVKVIPGKRDAQESFTYVNKVRAYERSRLDDCIESRQSQLLGTVFISVNAAESVGGPIGEGVGSQVFIRIRSSPRIG